MEIGATDVNELNNSLNAGNNFKSERNNLNISDSKIDQIISNNPSRVYLGKDIQVYKNILQNPGATIKLFVLRKGNPLQVTLKVRNILKRK